MADPDPKITKVIEKLKGKKAKVKKISAAPENTKASGLPPKLKASLEAAFDTDFSKVRIHTGGNAPDLAKELGAQAFTIGSDIFLAKSSSSSNHQLLAHELTHVVQQNSGKVPRSTPNGKALVSK